MRVAGSFCRTRWMPARVQPDERQREPGPQLVLHLLQHVPRGDDEDPLAAAAADQLGEDHADLQGLAEADGVGEQDAGPQVRRVQRLADGRLLVAQRVGQRPGRRRSATRSPSGTASCGSVDSSQSRAVRYRGLCVGDHPCVRPGRAARLGPAGCRSVAVVSRTSSPSPWTWTSSAVGCLLGRADEPLLVADDDDRSWCERTVDVRLGCRHRRMLRLRNRTKTTPNKSRVVTRRKPNRARSFTIPQRGREYGPKVDFAGTARRRHVGPHAPAAPHVHQARTGTPP